MTVWVIRNGVLVKKGSMQEARNDKRSIFPTPRLSRLEPYQSPIDGKEITSWSQRDKDLRDSNSYDPRDVSHERPKPKQLSLPFDRA
jgi:hypothetical protein